jgi:hypothetical protein
MALSVAGVRARLSGARPAGGQGALAQPASVPTITIVVTQFRSRFMSLILLEAFGALALLVLIVWWTMFSGRKNGELPEQPRADETDQTPPDRKD